MLRKLNRRLLSRLSVRWSWRRHRNAIGNTTATEGVNRLVSEQVCILVDLYRLAASLCWLSERKSILFLVHDRCVCGSKRGVPDCAFVFLRERLSSSSLAPFAARSPISTA